MNPKVSFVLPTRNRIEWMPQSLQSLIDQTEKDIEIIVVNDNSDDGTKEFLDDYAKKDPRIVVVHNSENQGGGRSRNIGMKCAKAPIIGVCDDDDFYPPTRAEEILRWFSEHPESELVNFPYMRVGYFDEHLEPFFGSEFDHDAFKKDGTVTYYCNPSAAYKTASGLEVGGYPPETKDKTDDVQFITNWVNCGKKIDFDNRAFGVLHRVLPSSMMVKNRGWNPEWVGAK
jgi:glycosyltransferase involved in cell wall biosynthesis